MSINQKSSAVVASEVLFLKKKKEPERHDLVMTRALRHISIFVQRLECRRIDQKKFDIVRRGGDAVNM
jgi:hypothetical protein